MTEARTTVYADAAGLLSRMGYAARPEPEFLPRGARRAVPALVTDAPPVVIGYAVAMVAEDPEAHLPERSARVARVPANAPGDTPWAFWAETQ